jgi:hypothetical protein
MSCAASARDLNNRNGKQLTKRALLIDPDNTFMESCSGRPPKLQRVEYGLDLFRHALDKASAPLVNVFKIFMASIRYATIRSLWR